MSDSTHEELQALFHAALDLSPEDRQAFLDERCPGLPDLRSEVERLLRHAEDDSPGFGTRATPLVAGLPPILELADDYKPERIGQFRILTVLGRGGMGVVYEAEQDSPRRVVALKVLLPGVATRDALQRFAFEVEALGSLQHPGIAQVFDAGVAETEHGNRPYFAMERVEGSNLLEWARAKSLRERLELFVEITDAVQHAHQKGVVHRDLKPDNLLVTDEGHPKVLDFGIARATNVDRTRATYSTKGVIGTLPYMSPEQAGGLDLDVRTDVYTLGVVLYELVDGALPYAIGDASLAQDLRTIEEATPHPFRHRKLRGDLETIARKALEKEPSRRYPTAAALGDDVLRYLRHEPIAARRATTLYQVRQFARRNRSLTVALVGLFLVMVAGIVATSDQARRVRAESDRLQRLNRFYRDMLLSVDPGFDGSEVRLFDVLDRVASNMHADFPGEDDMLEQNYQTFATVFRNLGQSGRARELAQEAYRLQANLFREEDPRSLETLHLIGGTWHDEYELDRALECYQRARDGLAAVLGSDDRLVLTIDHDTALLQQHREEWDEAERLFREVWDRERTALGEEDQLTLTTASAVAVLLVETDRVEEGIALHKETLEGRRKVLGPQHLETQNSLNNLGQAYWRAGNLEKAEVYLEEAVRGRLARLGEAHPLTLLSQQNLGGVLSRRPGRLRDAIDLLSHVAEAYAPILGPDHPMARWARNNLAFCLLQAKRAEEAREILQELTSATAENLASGDFDPAHFALNYARCLAELGELEESEFYLRLSVEVLGPLVTHDVVQLLAGAWEANGYGDRARTLRADLGG